MGADIRNAGCPGNQIAWYFEGAAPHVGLLGRPGVVVNAVLTSVTTVAIAIRALTNLYFLQVALDLKVVRVHLAPGTYSGAGC